MVQADRDHLAYSILGRGHGQRNAVKASMSNDHAIIYIEKLAHDSKSGGRKLARASAEGEEVGEIILRELCEDLPKPDDGLIGAAAVLVAGVGLPDTSVDISAHVLKFIGVVDAHVQVRARVHVLEYFDVVQADLDELLDSGL